MSDKPDDVAFEQVEEEPKAPAMLASLPVAMPQNAEQALGLLKNYFPMVDWPNLVLVRLKTQDDSRELLALPAHVMEQLLASVVSLCALLSHDGPKH